MSYADAIRTGGVLAKATKSTVFVYDWTSYKQPDPSHYDSDEENLTWSLQNGRALLVKLLCNNQNASIAMFAHSMGSRAVVETLSFIKIAKELGAPLRPNIKRIDLAASDLDVTTFKDVASTLKTFSITTNTYASRNDNALKASRILHPNHDRVGEDAAEMSGMPRVISVDATAADPLSLTDPIGHGYFQHPDLLEDIRQFFDGASPRARGHLIPSNDGSFWWFKKCSNCGDADTHPR